MLEDDKSKLIGYCGLYCKDCFNYKGEIADLARDLRKKLREEKFSLAAVGLSKYFKQFKEYDTCYEVLGAMVRLRCKHACKDGGGNPSCKIRKCCQKKEIVGCWKCTEFEKCEKLDFLKPIHENTHLKNLSKINKHGIDAFLSWKDNK